MSAPEPRRRVLSAKALPSRPPTLFTAVLYLMLEHVGAPGWVWGVCGTIAALFWLSYAYTIFMCETPSEPVWRDGTERQDSPGGDA